MAKEQRQLTLASAQRLPPAHNAPAPALFGRKPLNNLRPRQWLGQGGPGPIRVLHRHPTDCGIFTSGSHAALLAWIGTRVATFVCLFCIVVALLLSSRYFAGERNNNNSMH